VIAKRGLGVKNGVTAYLRVATEAPSANAAPSAATSRSHASPQTTRLRIVHAQNVRVRIVHALTSVVPGMRKSASVKHVARVLSKALLKRGGARDHAPIAKDDLLSGATRTRVLRSGADMATAEVNARHFGRKMHVESVLHFAGTRTVKGVRHSANSMLHEESSQSPVLREHPLAFARSAPEEKSAPAAARTRSAPSPRASLSAVERSSPAASRPSVKGREGIVRAFPERRFLPVVKAHRTGRNGSVLKVVRTQRGRSPLVSQPESSRRSLRPSPGSHLPESRSERQAHSISSKAIRSRLANAALPHGLLVRSLRSSHSGTPRKSPFTSLHLQQ
jgi:hypothetical protein